MDEHINDTRQSKKHEATEQKHSKVPAKKDKTKSNQSWICGSLETPGQHQHTTLARKENASYLCITKFGTCQVFYGYWCVCVCVRGFLKHGIFTKETQKLTLLNHNRIIIIHRNIFRIIIITITDIGRTTSLPPPHHYHREKYRRTSNETHNKHRVISIIIFAVLGGVPTFWDTKCREI